MLQQPGVQVPPHSNPLPHGERRVRVRFQAGFMTLCQNDAAGVGDFWWLARVLNISAEGIALLVPRAFDRDALVVIEPTDPSAALSSNLHARVVRTEERGRAEARTSCSVVAGIRLT